MAKPTPEYKGDDVADTSGDFRRPLSIERYLHCKRCILERARPSRISAGMTIDGFQVWCERHKCNVAYITIAEMQEIPPCDSCALGIPHTHDEVPRG